MMAGPRVHEPPPGVTGPYGLPLPEFPPFKVFVANIPYEIDEEVVAHFFRGLNVRPPARPPAPPPQQPRRADTAPAQHSAA